MKAFLLDSKQGTLPPQLNWHRQAGPTQIPTGTEQTPWVSGTGFTGPASWHTDASSKQSGCSPVPRPPPQLLPHGCAGPMSRHPAFRQRIQKFRCVHDFLGTVEIIRTLHKCPVSLFRLMFALPQLSEVRQGHKKCDQEWPTSL